MINLSNRLGGGSPLVEAVARPRRLGRCFGMDSQFWINLQSHYDLEVEMDALGDGLDKIKPLRPVA